jgi:UDP-N-acetylmuramoylalanine--D-glutamate ligase
LTVGADKILDFSPLIAAIRLAREQGRLRALVLLAGTGSDKLRSMLDAEAIPYQGPRDSAEAAARSAVDAAETGDAVVLSPGCASFGMFLNEFDRGRKWKEAVSGLSCTSRGSGVVQ